MHLDVSPCQDVSCLPQRMTERVINQHFHRALISLKKSTLTLTLLAGSHWNKSHTWSPQQCIPGRLLCQLLASSFIPKNFITCLTSCMCPRQQRVWKGNMAIGSLWQAWAVQSLLCVVLLLWKQQKDDAPWTKLSKQCNYKMAKG